MVKMFVFPFGNGDYDKQSAVVLAETIEEAKEKLLADIDRQMTNHGKWPGSDELDCNWRGEDGFTGSFSRERLTEAEQYDDSHDDKPGYMASWEASGEIAYIFGLDG